MSESRPEVRYRAIPNADGYRVGDDGTAWSRRLSGTKRLSDNWRLLKNQRDVKTGYARVTLRVGGRTVHAYVHRLVLEAFIGPCPEGMESCHFPDPDRMNCRLDNLRWDTPSANQKDKVVHGTSNRGERQHMAQLSESDVLEMLEVKREIPGATYDDLAFLFGVTSTAVASIFQGRNWGWLTKIERVTRKRGCPPGGSRKHYRDLDLETP